MPACFKNERLVEGLGGDVIGMKGGELEAGDNVRKEGIGFYK